jgi:glutamine cyclotransferase
MHFGPANLTLKNSKLLIFTTLLFSIICISCKQDSNSADAGFGFKSPEQGKEYLAGQEVQVQLDVPKGETVNSVTYLLDNQQLGTKNDSSAFTFPTKDLTLGYKLVSAVVDHGGTKDTLTVNILIKSSIKPVIYSYEVLNTYPHDTTSYTQGLEYHDGRFLESTGEYGQSTLRWVDVKSGKTLQRMDFEQQYFAEGSTLIDGKVVLLTWQNNMGFVYDAKSFKQLSTFNYQNSREGWGLTFDGKQLLKSDGTNKIWFLNKETYQEEKSIEVFDDKGAVDQLNELEYIDGKLYANVYQSNRIAIIDPKTGAVEAYIDASGILPKSDNFMNTDVLNGIAWDAKAKKLYITGKKWDKLFEIKLVPSKLNL